MSNRAIIRKNRIREDNDKSVIIDANEIFDEKIDEIKKDLSLRQPGNKDENADDGVVSPDSGTQESIDEYKSSILSDAREEADRILNDARNQSENIINDARNDAEKIRSDAEADGKEEGRRLGLDEAREELSSMKAELQAEKQKLISQYSEKEEQMEEKLVDAILEVVDHVFHSELSGKKDIIMHLVEDTLSGCEPSGEFLIHMSPTNIRDFSDEIKKIRSDAPENTNIEFVSDEAMGDDMCTIETDGGIFDCSIDTELDGLMRDIKALSGKG